MSFINHKGWKYVRQSDEFIFVSAHCKTLSSLEEKKYDQIPLDCQSVIDTTALHLNDLNTYRTRRAKATDILIGTEKRHI